MLYQTLYQTRCGPLLYSTWRSRCKHRFRTSSLVARSSDKRRALLREESSIIAIFEHSDGSLYWTPGFIEELGVATADVDVTSLLEATPAARQPFVQQLQEEQKRLQEEPPAGESRGGDEGSRTRSGVGPRPPSDAITKLVSSIEQDRLVRFTHMESCAPRFSFSR